MNFSAGLRVARVRGIDILVHWSWLLIFVLISWSLVGYFNSEFTDWSREQAWVVGVLAAFGFFASVLLHELSHAIVAQRYGMSVPSITLFVFGGVSNIAGEMQSARQEFLVAAAGPAMSIVLAVVLTMTGLVLGGHVGEVVLYLGVVNGLLGVFNLLPGFPLDGGRVFRSIVWARTRDLMRATRLASQVGQGIAWLMIAGGVWVALTISLTGLWYVFIGLFLKQAAEASYQQLLLDEMLRGVPSRRLMRPPPEPMPESASLQTVVDERLLAEGERCVLLNRDGRVTGLLTVTDVSKVAREEWPTTSAHRVMIPADQVATVTPLTPVNEATRLMAERDVHQVPVIEDGQLVGLLTRGDVLNYIQLRMQFGDAVDAAQAIHAARSQRDEPPR